MKKFHFTLILFLIIQSVFSQVEIKVNHGKRLSVLDTLEISFSLEKYLDNYSIDQILKDPNRSNYLDLEFQGVEIKKDTISYEENENESRWWERTVFVDANDRFKNNNSNKDFIRLVQDGDNKLKFRYKSNKRISDLFNLKENEYLNIINFSLAFSSTDQILLNRDNLCADIKSSIPNFKASECVFDFFISDKVNLLHSKKMFLSDNVKNNLNNILLENTEDLMNTPPLGEASLSWPIYEDFNNDGIRDLISRIYTYGVGAVTRSLSNEEKKKLISRIAFFKGTKKINDSIVYELDSYVDEKSEGPNLKLIDIDADGDKDLISVSDVWHGLDENRPSWFKTGKPRPLHIYKNDGNGNFTQDSITLDNGQQIFLDGILQINTVDKFGNSDGKYEFLTKSDVDYSNETSKINKFIIEDGKYKFVSKHETNYTSIAGYANYDVNGDGYLDLITHGHLNKYKGEIYKSTKSDIREFYLDVYYGNKDSINLDISNRNNLAKYERPEMQSTETGNFNLIKFNNTTDLLIIWLTRNSNFYDDRVEGVPASEMLAFKITNNTLLDVTEEIFPNGLSKNFLMQGNPPYFRDIDNDNDLDLVFDGFPWNGGSNGVDIMAFINDGEKFIPRYFTNFSNVEPYEINDIDNDGYAELIIMPNGNLDMYLKAEQDENYDRNKRLVFELNFFDKDYDGIEDLKDNCPNKYNPNQEDTDGDGFGDICDNYEDTFSIEGEEIIEDVVIVSSEFQQLVDNEGYDQLDKISKNYFNSPAYDYKDFNGDGFKDIIISVIGHPHIGTIEGVFLWNDEIKKFEDLTTHIMINRGESYFFEKTVYDFDDDGDLDVYIPAHNYHGEEGKQPDYYFEGGQRFPGHYFINEGDKFYRKMIDSVVVDHGNRKDYPGFDKAYIIDLNNNGKKDLLSVVMNSGYPGYESSHFFAKYSIDKNKNINKEFIFPWKEDYRYEGAYHSLLVKEDKSNIYVFNQPKELSINGVGPYSYPEVWIYKKDGKFSSKDPQKIKLNRNKNIRDAGSLLNRETFYIVDLDNDGVNEYLIGMFKMPHEDEHASFHVFDNNGNEITDKWFNGREFIDSTSSAANGFLVQDLNNDGYIDLIPHHRVNSRDEDIVIFMNTGKKFNNFIIDKKKNGWHMPVDIDNDSIYEFLTFNTKDDPSNISSVVKINYSGFDNDNDDDGIVNSLDNCPDTSNPDQKDTDGDGIGDVCDDSDGDGVLDLDDQCPFTNPDETVNENGCSETELNIDNSSGLVVANNQIGKKFLTDLYSFEIQEGNCPSTEDDIANGDCFNCSVRYFIWEDNYIIFDYNNDGKDDLFAFLINAGEDGIFQSDENPTGKLMFYEDYLSESTEPQYFDSEIVWGGWLDVNDFNGDGFYDILVTANNSHEVSKVTNEQFENIPFEIFFFDSNGFSERKVLDMENASSNGPMSGDIDKDGDIDIIQPKIKTDEDKRSYVLVNDGNGNFSQNFEFLTEIENKQERLEMSDHGQILFDINKDGCLDWVVPVMNNGKFVIEDGKLIEKEIDGDGPTEYDDLIYINGEYVKSGSRILWGDCSGNYSFENSNYFDQHQDYLLSELSEYNLESLYGALSYNVFDYNNDGVNDIILSKNYGNRATGLQLFKGNSDGSYSDVTQDTFDKFFFKNSGNNGETIEGDFPRIWNIAVKDKDGDGDLDLIPWGMSEFQDRCWKDLLSGEEYWEFVNGKFYFRSDKDLDGVYDHLDNCPEIANEDQADTDGDGKGDVCDNDKDGDGVLNSDDNCPETANEDQSDIDGDGIGDVCDDDIDGDGILNDSDNCPETANEDQADMDGDGIGDVCDDDKDGDTILNAEDNCPETANEDQSDIDGDGLGDVCDDDKDGDTILNADDNCPETSNQDQSDIDGDGIGDNCDDDVDGDGVLNTNDNCPNTPEGTTVDVNGC